MDDPGVGAGAGRAAVRIGCSGWDYRHWRGRFYPEALPRAGWLAHYAARFDTVEVNRTFYRLPEPAAVERWREEVPSGFAFAVKASRYLTHMRKLREPAEPLARFLDVARHLGRALGPLLYQLPPRWRCDRERLGGFLAVLPPDLTHVVEFRDQSWLVEPVRMQLAAAGVGFCVHDAEEVDVPRWVTGPVAYVRFHGTREGLRRGYPDRVLDDWASWLHGEAGRGRAAYAFFNNDPEGHAVRDALRLKARFARR